MGSKLGTKDKGTSRRPAEWPRAQRRRGVCFQLQGGPSLPSRGAAFVYVPGAAGGDAPVVPFSFTTYRVRSPATSLRRHTGFHTCTATVTPLVVLKLNVALHALGPFHYRFTTTAMSSFLKTASVARTSAPSPTPSNASASGAKRKRPEEAAAVVYSQPQETGTGNHIYTQLTYTIDYLRQNQRWMTFKEIMDYLNIRADDHTTRQHLTTLFRSESPQNRISYNPKDNTYRYKPKFDIRNTAQLKGYFQQQKSSQGLSVKDLKDGWANVHEDLKELEAKKEVLVKRNLKDQQARTVYVV
jgi:hypothetical protein